MAPAWLNFQVHDAKIMKVYLKRTGLNDVIQIFILSYTVYVNVPLSVKPVAHRNTNIYFSSMLNSVLAIPKIANMVWFF